jgi:hypothetical protein
MKRTCSRTETNFIELPTTQIAAIADECRRAVEVLSSCANLSDEKLAECARLSDSLESSHRSLKFAVAQIAISKRKRAHNQNHWMI